MSLSATHAQFIVDARGKKKSVVLPIGEYEDMLEALEDAGLGKAMKEAEKDRTYSRKHALEYLKHA